MSNEKTTSAEIAKLEPADSEYQRYHPLGMLLESWALLVALIGFGISFFADLSESISVETIFNWLANSTWILLLVLGALLYALSSIIKWFTVKWAINEHGAFQRSKFISVNRRIAPRERIESVSIERSFWARIFGLSSVKIELAGAGDSFYKLEYLGRKQAEEIYSQILALANTDANAVDNLAETAVPDESRAAVSNSFGGSADPGSANFAIANSGSAENSVAVVGAAASAKQSSIIERAAFAGDDLSSFQLAKIPTSRLLKSMLLDVGLLFSVFFSVICALIWLIWQIADGFELSFGALFIAIPILFAGPRVLFGHLESGWGFISRSTDKGLKARRGLFNTHNDNISAERIQSVKLSRSMLWAGTNWAKVTIATSGIDAIDEGSSTKVLPVGEPAEVKNTLEQIFPAIGGLAAATNSSPPAAEITALANEELILALLGAKAKAVGGFQPVHWSYLLARKFDRLQLAEKAVLIRRGWLVKSLNVLQREKIQSVSLTQGPLQRLWGIATIRIETAGENETFGGIKAQDALNIVNLLSIDAGTSRRYSERETWALPRLKYSKHPKPVMTPELNATGLNGTGLNGTVLNGTGEA